MALITSCRICQTEDLKPFLDLGKQALANSLIPNPQMEEVEYPLSLVWCPTCTVAQLNYTVNPEQLFSTYVWVTGTSKGANDFSERFCHLLIDKTPEPQKGYVLEVASNDGTFLKPFQKRGYEVLGVDPALNIVEMALESGVPTECAFWGTESARKVVASHGKAHMIFARNVLAHVADTRDFVAGLADALDEDGVVAVEPHYAGVIQKECHYDSIYHEHLCYLTLRPIEYLLEHAGLHPFDIEESPISGGAIIVYASKQKWAESDALLAYRKKEEDAALNTLESWNAFGIRAKEHSKHFRQTLIDLNKEYQVVVGWGASARSSTLLNCASADTTLISVIADKNPLKHNLYTAGTHIPVKDPAEVMALKPDVVVILGWNFRDEIQKELQEKYAYSGMIVTPLPDATKVSRL